MVLSWCCHGATERVNFWASTAWTGAPFSIISEIYQVEFNSSVMYFTELIIKACDVESSHSNRATISLDELTDLICLEFRKGSCALSDSKPMKLWHGCL